MTCPVCLDKYSDQKAEISHRSGGMTVDCLVCGEFRVSDEVCNDTLLNDGHTRNQVSDSQRVIISYWLHYVRENGQRKPTLESVALEELINGAFGLPGPIVQVDNILRYLGDAVRETGDDIQKLPDELFSRMGSMSPEFFKHMISEAIRSGLVTTAGDPRDQMFLNLSLQGWDRFESLDRGVGSSTQGFLAMKFGDATLDEFVKDVLKPGVLDELNYHILDMRDVARAGVIDNLMRAQIRSSAFVIADLTHDNPGAYWEAGYAEGLGKPVIYICEQKKFKDKKTHFDTSHSTTVVWDAMDGELFVKEMVATIRRSLNLY